MFDIFMTRHYHTSTVLFMEGDIMSDIDIHVLMRILLAFDRHSCLSKDQLSENTSKRDRFVDPSELESGLRRLVDERILIEDADLFSNANRCHT